MVVLCTRQSIAKPQEELASSLLSVTPTYALAYPCSSREDHRKLVGRLD
jgi:hypothetical protein